MRYGRSVEDGFLPVFSTNTEEEAKELLRLTCQTNHAGEFFRWELALDRTLDTLELFAQKLAKAYPIALQLIAKRNDAQPVSKTNRRTTGRPRRTRA